MLPARKRVRLSADEELDALAGLDTSDNGETMRIVDGGEQLVVLAEAEVVEPCAGRQRNSVELDDAPHTGTTREMGDVDGKAVRDVEQPVSDAPEPPALVDPKRRTQVPPLAKRRA